MTVVLQTDATVGTRGPLPGEKSLKIERVMWLSSNAVGSASLVAVVTMAARVKSESEPFAMKELIDDDSKKGFEKNAAPGEEEIAAATSAAVIRD